MATAPVLVSVEEYMSTVYRPDRDYVDGEVLERNAGEKPHSRLQGFFLTFFRTYEEEWNFEALVEQRLQINATRYRIPDLMLTALPDPDERIVAPATSFVHRSPLQRRPHEENSRTAR